MSTSSKPSIFGQKGVRDSAVSLAEMLLTGKPVGRRSRQDRIPKLKPRPKPIFGRKGLSSSQREKASFGACFVVGLVILGLGVATIVQIVVAS